MSTNTAETSTGPLPGLLLHGAGSDAETWLPNLMRSAANAAADLGAGRDIHVVVQGPGVALLAKGRGPGEQLGTLLEAGVRVFACGNSLRSAGLSAADLAPGIDTVPAAVGHLARQQWAGWAYVRI